MNEVLILDLFSEVLILNLFSEMLILDLFSFWRVIGATFIDVFFIIFFHYHFLLTCVIVLGTSVVTAVAILLRNSTLTNTLWAPDSFQEQSYRYLVNK